MEEKKVVVLLSAYNGEKYLREQLDSILGQSYKNIMIYIRDDGSTDGTGRILEEYSTKENIKIFMESNIGLIKSFFKLLEFAPKDADYFSFSDQDDVWHKDKIARAVRALSDSGEEPALYYCGLDITDENLNHLKNYIKPKLPLNLKTSIAGSCVTGAATVLNAAARRLIIEELPQYTVVHDWWMYIVVSAFGKIIYEEEPGIKYRQHSSNTIGIKANPIEFALLRFKKWRNGVYYKKISSQAREFYRIFGERLQDTDKLWLEEFLKTRRNIFTRFIYALNCPLYRQGIVDTVILKMMIIFNQI